MSFRNVDAFPRIVGKWDYATLLRILFVNSRERQRRYSEIERRIRATTDQLALTEVGGTASDDPQEGGPNLSTWVVSLVVSLTVLISVSLGIAAAYAVVNGILYAIADHSQPRTAPQGVLMARNAQAGAN